MDHSPAQRDGLMDDLQIFIRESSRFDCYKAQGTRHKGQGTMDKGQGTRDKAQGTRHKGHPYEVLLNFNV